MKSLDEAIRHCEEVAEQNETKVRNIDNLIGSPIAKYQNECVECAADHRQLAEWLTELKEAKRLLKLAVDIVHDYACGFCPCCKNYDKGRCIVDIYDCQHNDKWGWRYEAEALKLLGSER